MEGILWRDLFVQITCMQEITGRIEHYANLIFCSIACNLQEVCGNLKIGNWIQTLSILHFCANREDYGQYGNTLIIILSLY